MRDHIRAAACLLLLASLPVSGTVAAQEQKNTIRFNQDTLVLNDGISRQQLLWKRGKLSWLTVEGLRTGQKMHELPAGSCMPMLEPFEAERWSSDIVHHGATLRCNAYSDVLLTTWYDSFAIRLTIRIYDNTAGTEWGFSIKGKQDRINRQEAGGLSMIEDQSALQNKHAGYFYLPVDGHFTAQIANFKAATDYHNNLVQEIGIAPYKKPQRYPGNVLQIVHKQPGVVHEIVKLSPLQEAQSAYAGFDFSAGFDGVSVCSPGWQATGHDSSFQKGYSVYLLLFAKNTEEADFFYQQYEMSCRHYIPESDNTFTMNTWGDRHRDGRIRESFILKELGAASRLGITQYQIDDGWQQGTSQNSAKRNGGLWDHWTEEDWRVNRQRFPNGLTPVLKKAKANGIAIGLWFNPSKKDRYSARERDEQILLDLYKKYNIRWIKIDGLEIGDKQAEENVAQLLRGVQEKTGGQVQFNMDVTAGRRGGYFFLNRMGNIFLENRYTDWGNYYPHLTLRNVWQLAKYVPVQRLQIEWLNKWRNEDKYRPSDSLRPAAVPFDYQFAIAMMGQPLAWMEATGLPEKAFGIRALIDLWKQHRSSMAMGIVQPVGDCPDGYSFPGFVSYAGNRIYVLFFRELAGEEEAVFHLPLANLKGKKFIRLYGTGSVSRVDRQNRNVSVRIDRCFQFIWGYFE